MIVSDIREVFLNKYKNQEFNEQGLLEIIGASFVADEVAIFGVPNEDYIKKEIAWYNSKSRNVYDMANPPEIWKAVATKDGLINSNYGWCIFSEENHRQYHKIVSHLRDNQFTRQATMIYTRPTMHEDCKVGGMSDFICTNAVNYIFRNNKLHCTVQMRSNDAIFGYKNDYAWQSYVLDRLCNDLNVAKGAIHWQVASLHIYPRHFRLLDDIK